MIDYRLPKTEYTFTVKRYCFTIYGVIKMPVNILERFNMDADGLHEQNLISKLKCVLRNISQSNSIYLTCESNSEL